MRSFRFVIFYLIVVLFVSFGPLGFAQDADQPATNEPAADEPAIVQAGLLSRPFATPPTR